MIKLNKKIKFHIAADGTSASGKTTGGKYISKYFGFKFLSSGALYRYCALKILKNNKKYNAELVKKIADSITMNDLNHNQLYDPKVTQLSSIIAKKALTNFSFGIIKK